MILRSSFFFLFFYTLLFSQENIYTDQKKDLKISVEAEQSTYNSGIKKSIIFEGSVKFNDGNMKIVCDKMWVYLDVNGQPVKVVAKGEIVIVKEKIKAQSDNLTYDIAKKLVVFTGNSQISQDGHIMQSETIHYQIKENKITIPEVEANFEEE